MKNSDIPIKYIKTGIASSFSTHIEINEKLKNHPELLEKIIEHERRHDFGKYSSDDFENDFFKKTGINQKEYFKFIISNPCTWSQFLPITYKKNCGFFIDWSLVILWAISIGFIFGIVMLFIFAI